MKLSVIIPVYQSADTLPRCLQSVLSQHVDNIEVILVDDGSTDQSPQLCDEYARQHPAVSVVHQPNSGAAAARNAGLAHATGDYLVFIDSDDNLAPDTYRPLLAIAASHPEYDLIEYSITERLADGSLRSFCTLPEQTFTSLSDYWLSTKAYRHTFVWNKLYRRELWNGVNFTTEPFEDYALMNRLLPLCRCIRTTACGRHFYDRTDRLSLSHRATGHQMELLLRESLKMMSHCVDKSFYEAVLNIQITVCRQTHADPILPVMPYRGSWKLTLMHLLGMQRFCQWMRLVPQCKKTT